MILKWARKSNVCQTNICHTSIIPTKFEENRKMETNGLQKWVEVRIQLPDTQGKLARHN